MSINIQQFTVTPQSARNLNVPRVTIATQVDALQASVDARVASVGSAQITEIQHTLNETQAAVLQIQQVCD